MNEINRLDDFKKEMEDLSPGFPGKTIHNPPSGYFEKFPDRMMKNWTTHTSHGVRYLTLKRMISAAALVSGLCLGVMWWTNESNSNTSTIQISSNDAYTYILENLEEFSPLLLEESQISDSEIIVPEPSATEDYLLEELDGDDLETLF